MKQGQAIIEVIIAFAVATVALVGLVQVVTKSMANSGMSARQAQATAYAREGLEWIKQQKTSMTWNSFYTLGANYCLNTLAWTAGTCAVGSTIGSTEFTRNVSLAPGVDTAVQMVLVTVDVSWSESGRLTHSLQKIVYYQY